MLGRLSRRLSRLQGRELLHRLSRRCSRLQGRELLPWQRPSCSALDKASSEGSLR